MIRRDARGRFRKPTDEERGFPPGFLDTMRKRFDSAKYEFGIVQLAAKADLDYYAGSQWPASIRNARK